MGLVADAAEAKPPKIGEQVTLKSRISPVSLPQLHVARGEKMPKRYRIVKRVITMGGTQKARTKLSAPRGYRIRLLVDGGSYRAWKTKPLGKYRGRRQVRLVAISTGGRNSRGPGDVYAVVQRVRG